MKDIFNEYEKIRLNTNTNIEIFVKKCDKNKINSPMLIYQILFEVDEGCGIKKYIGKTVRDLQERLLEHLRGFGGNIKRIYVSVLKECDSLAQLNFYEHLYIKNAKDKILSYALNIEIGDNCHRQAYYPILQKYMKNIQN